MSDSELAQQLPEKKDFSSCIRLGWRPASSNSAYGCLLTASMLLITRLGVAQDSLRNAWANEAAAGVQLQPTTSQPYTFKEGDFRLLAVPSVEMDYNDNVGLSKTDTIEDFILKPLLQLTGSYPITQHNLLTFSVGVGYDEYLEHSQYSAPRVNSDSLLSFDVSIKDFRINIHDRFSYYQDPSTEPSLAGTAIYGGLNNSAGLTTTWDLEDIVLTLGYDHQNFVSSSEEFSYNNRSSELPFIRAGFRFNPQVTVGVEGSASFTAYDQDVLNDNRSYSVGVYGDLNNGSYFHIQPRAGYVIYQFQTASESTQLLELTPSGVPMIVPTGESIQMADLSSWYANLTVSHQINKAISYALSAGHEIQPGIESDVVEDWYFRPNITWSIIQNLSMSTSFFYERGTQGLFTETGNLTETFNWYGGALVLSYPLMKKLLVSLNYRLTLRDSNIASQEYAQNLVGIKFSYQP